MSTRVGIEVGQIWENRNARRDGSRERVTVLEVNARAALCESNNPSKGKEKIRSIGIMVYGQGSPLLGNLRLVQTADRRSVHFAGDGVLELGQVRDLEGAAGLEALAAVATPTKLEAFLAAAAPARRAFFRRHLQAVVEVFEPSGFGLPEHMTRAGRHAIIEAFVVAGAAVVEEASRFRSSAPRVSVSTSRARSIGVPGKKAWPSSALTPAGLEFAAHLIKQREASL